jgi:hypothetical protein
MLQDEDFLLWTAIAVLSLFLALLLRRRSRLAARRAERAREAVLAEDLGGNSYFMPIPEMAQAVEIDDPVEIDSLLSGEPDTIIGATRNVLAAPTDIGTPDLARALDLGMAAVQPPAPWVPSAPATSSATEPAPARAQASAAPTREAVPSAGSAAKSQESLDFPPTVLPPAEPRAAARDPLTALEAEEGVRLPLRELVLTWFEARGYRAAAPAERGAIDRVLRHHKDASRSYAFVVEANPLTTARASSLRVQARANGMERLLIAAEAGIETGVAEALKRQGVRVLDRAGMSSELARLDIGIAAKIIAVARKRAATRAPSDSPSGS